MEILPGVHHADDVSSQAVWAGQSAPEVQVDGAEGSNGAVGTTAEDQVVRDGQTGGLRHLETEGTLGKRLRDQPTATCGGCRRHEDQRLCLSGGCISVVMNE